MHTRYTTLSTMAKAHITSKSNTCRFYVYIVECADTTLYIGSTNDLVKRIHSHNYAKSGAKYTRARRPVVLKYSEDVETYAGARALEAKFKRFSRKEKLALFASPESL